MDPLVVARGHVRVRAGVEQQVRRRLGPEEGGEVQGRETIARPRRDERRILGQELTDPRRPAGRGGLEDVELVLATGRDDPLEDRRPGEREVARQHDRREAVAVARGGERGILGEEALDAVLVTGPDGREQRLDRSHERRSLARSVAPRPFGRRRADVPANQRPRYPCGPLG